MHELMGKTLLVALVLAGSMRTDAAQKATVEVSPFSCHMPPSLAPRRTARATCDGVDATAKCADWIKQTAVAQSNADRDRLAKSEWHNCMNDAFHESYGEYPIEAWRVFLKEFGIQETVVTTPRPGGASALRQSARFDRFGERRD